MPKNSPRRIPDMFCWFRNQQAAALRLMQSKYSPSAFDERYKAMLSPPEYYDPETGRRTDGFGTYIDPEPAPIDETEALPQWHPDNLSGRKRAAWEFLKGEDRDGAFVTVRHYRHLIERPLWRIDEAACLLHGYPETLGRKINLSNGEPVPPVAPVDGDLWIPDPDPAETYRRLNQAIAAGDIDAVQHEGAAHVRPADAVQWFKGQLPEALAEAMTNRAPAPPAPREQPEAKDTPEGKPNRPGWAAEMHVNSWSDIRIAVGKDYIAVTGGAWNKRRFDRARDLQFKDDDRRWIALSGMAAYGGAWRWQGANHNDRWAKNVASELRKWFKARFGLAVDAKAAPLKNEAGEFKAVGLRIVAAHDNPLSQAQRDAERARRIPEATPENEDADYLRGLGYGDGLDRADRDGMTIHKTP